MNCQICQRECKNYISLSAHVSHTHKLTSKEYYDKYLKKENEEICSECGKETKFRKISLGYHEFCSLKCFNKSEKAKNNLRNIFLNKNDEEKNSIYKKRRQTNLEKYGVENTFQSEKIKEKIKQTNLEKYGCENPSQNKEINNKRINNNLEKYGVTCTLYDKETNKKVKKTNLEKYGCENPSQNKEIQEKKEKIFLEKYGYKTPLKNEEIKIKIKNKLIETNTKKYGVKYPFQSKEIRNKSKITKLNNSILKVNKLLEYLDLDLISEYNCGYDLIEVRCRICNLIFKTKYNNLYFNNCGKCLNCFPKDNGISDKDIPEWVLRNKEGYSRIWDCGHLKFIMRNNL